MAFKIESFETMRNIANRVDDRANEMSNVKTNAMSSLENLKTNIVCDGITETLDSLSSSIASNTDAVNNLFMRIAAFINEQVAGYAESNETVGTNLDTAATGFESVK